MKTTNSSFEAVFALCTGKDLCRTAGLIRADNVIIESEVSQGCTSELAEALGLFSYEPLSPYVKKAKYKNGCYIVRGNIETTIDDQYVNHEFTVESVTNLEV